MIVVAVTLTFDESRYASLVEAAMRVAAPTRAEDGCIRYEFFADVEQSGRMLLYEEWESDGTLEAHLASPHLKEFRSFLAANGVTRELGRYEVVD